MPSIRKLADHEVRSLRRETPRTAQEEAPNASAEAARDRPAMPSTTAVQGAGVNRLPNKSAAQLTPPPTRALKGDIVQRQRPAPATSVTPTEQPMQREVEQSVIVPVAVPTQASPAPAADHKDPQEALVQLRPVELHQAARRGDIVHLTLGAGITLCGVRCEEDLRSSRSYFAAGGCQRCAYMVHQLQARCASCGQPALHITGAGACVTCGNVGTTIQLP